MRRKGVRARGVGTRRWALGGTGRVGGYGAHSERPGFRCRANLAHSQGQVLAVAVSQNDLKRFKLFPLRSAVGENGVLLRNNMGCWRITALT